MVPKKKQMAAGEFKARCLQVMDEVLRHRQPVIVTKRGKPVVRIVPVEEEGGAHSIFGCMAGEIEILGDIESPVTARADWEALK